MRALLFLGLVGAAIYGFLIVTGDETSGTTRDGVAIQTQPNHSAERMSSWGSYLPSRPSSENPQSARSQGFAASSQHSDEPSQNSGRDQRAPAGSGSASSDIDGVKAASPVVSPSPTQVAEASVTEPLKRKSKRTAGKSIKRNPSAKRDLVANADPWNDRRARRVDRRRGVGLFMFRSAPRFAVNGR